jgi:hypothetical protein
MQPGLLTTQALTRMIKEKETKNNHNSKLSMKKPAIDGCRDAKFFNPKEVSLSKKNERI